MKKRLIAFLLSLLVVVSGITPVFAVEEQPQEEQSAQEQTHAAETALEELTEEKPAAEPEQDTPEATEQETAPTLETSSGTCGENLTWTLDDEGTLTISGTGAMTDYPGANAPWYDQRSSIQTVVIGDGVTSIGDYAFYDCDSLASVEIPDSVTSIGDDAFYHCDSLTSVTIGNSVTSIGDYAFRYCESLTSVEIPDSVTSIGDYAFRSCESLTSVTIGNSVTSIGDEAFSYCDSLTEIYFRGAKPSIGSSAFYKVTATAYYPDSWTSVPSSTAYGATNITWVEYNPGVSSGETTDGIQLSDQSIVVGKTDSVSISIYQSTGGAAELAEAAAVSVADSGIATVQKTGSVTGSAGGKSAAFTVKVTGKKVGETELTVTCGDSVSKTVKLSVTEPCKIDVNETDPEKLKEQLGIDKDSLAMDDITISMGKLKGPTFQLLDYDMTLFSMDSKVNLDLSKLGAQIMIDPDDKTVKVQSALTRKRVPM